MHVVVQTLLEHATTEIVGLARCTSRMAAQSSGSPMRAFLAALANQAVLKTRAVLAVTRQV
jgi:hypothetical protein